MKPFKSNDYPTVGVEQEFQLLDPDTGDLASACDMVIQQMDEELAKRSVYELFTSVIEIPGRPYKTVQELLEGVIADRRNLHDACVKAGVLPAASGCHPFARWREQTIVDSDHYRWVVKETGFLARRLLSFGLHVHVGMKSAESALYAQNQFLRWAYPLLALSVNSSFL